MDPVTELLQCIAAGRRADGLSLGGADLSQSAFRTLRMAGSRLDGANLEKSDWGTAVLRMCTFIGVRGDAVCFDDASVEDSSFEGADLTQASFRRAKLSETSFERAALRYAVFDSASGTGLQFRGATLRDVSLVGARFEEADFRGADLRNANLSGARLRGADFRGALLDYACFDDADCTNAEFDSDAAAPAPKGNSASDAAAQNEIAALLWQYLNQIRPQVPGGLMGELFDNAGIGPDKDATDPLAQFGAALEPLLRELEALTEGQGSVETLKAEFQKLSEQTLTRLGEAMPPEEWEQLFAAMGMHNEPAKKAEAGSAT